MMNRFVIIILIHISGSCHKQIEKRFPPGYYQLSISNSFFEYNGNNYEGSNYSYDLEIISAINNEIKMRAFKYQFNWEGDTSFANISTLYVTDNKYTLGNFATVNGVSYNLYDGVISEKSKKKYIITGKFESISFAEFGPYEDWIVKKGDFKIEEK